MSKNAAIKTTKPEKVRQAKNAFYSNLFDMTWRMLLAMAVPILLGSFLDKKLDTDDMFTAFGFLLSFVSAGFVIKSTVSKIDKKDIN